MLPTFEASAPSITLKIYEPAPRRPRWPPSTPRAARARDEGSQIFSEASPGAREHGVWGRQEARSGGCGREHWTVGAPEPAC